MPIANITATMTDRSEDTIDLEHQLSEIAELQTRFNQLPQVISPGDEESIEVMTDFSSFLERCGLYEDQNKVDRWLAVLKTSVSPLKCNKAVDGACLLVLPVYEQILSDYETASESNSEDLEFSVSSAPQAELV